MRRLAAILAGLLLAGVAVAVTSCGGGGSSYKVRALFDDASFVVKGEDVKIAGVKVGSIQSTSVTKDRKAAVVLDITDPGFQDFRTDASCAIRPQSLIGEQYVECSPTEGRASTSAAAPKLRKIDSGPGKGQYLLPVDRNSISVALDLLGDLNTMPVRQRLSLIINELGVGLAGRGEDLNAVIRRSAPALQELDKVIDLVATQNKQLKQLSVDGDTIMRPLAAKRKDLTGFIKQSQKVAQATAERREALEAGLRRFPTFLRETAPTMRRLGGLADQLTPVATDLRAQAPAINQVIERTGPFSRAGTTSLLSLGAAAKPGIPAIRASLPIARNLRTFSSRLRPVAGTLADVLTSFEKNDGLENVLNFAFYSAQAANGFDSLGHFLRAGLIVNECTTYAVQPQVTCAAKFSGRSASASSASVGSQPRDLTLARTAAVLRGEDPEKVLADPAYQDGSDDGTTATRTRSSSTPTAGAVTGAAREGTVTGAVATATPTATPGAASSPEATEGPLLDFLFGKDAQ